MIIIIRIYAFIDNVHRFLIDARRKPDFQGHSSRSPFSNGNRGLSFPIILRLLTNICIVIQIAHLVWKPFSWWLESWGRSGLIGIKLLSMKYKIRHAILITYVKSGAKYAGEAHGSSTLPTASTSGSLRGTSGGYGTYRTDRKQ